jgi:hypothetical protein
VLAPPPQLRPKGAGCEKRLTPSGDYTNYDPVPGGNATGGQTQQSGYLMVGSNALNALARAAPALGLCFECGRELWQIGVGAGGLALASAT